MILQLSATWSVLSQIGKVKGLVPIPQRRLCLLRQENSAARALSLLERVLQDYPPLITLCEQGTRSPSWIATTVPAAVCVRFLKSSCPPQSLQPKLIY